MQLMPIKQLNSSSKIRLEDKVADFFSNQAPMPLMELPVVPPPLLLATGSLDDINRRPATPADFCTFFYYEGRGASPDRVFQGIWQAYPVKLVIERGNYEQIKQPQLSPKSFSSLFL